MSHYANRCLSAALGSIEPSQAQKSSAASSHNYLRRVLSAGPVADKIERVLLIGSYGRRTAISPIDDIDVLVVLRTDAWPAAFFCSGPDAAKVVRDLHRAIKRGYPRTPVRRQRRSIGIRKQKQPIDVVPALPTNADGVFLIPDRDEEGWLQTAPALHTQRVLEINASTGKLFIPTIKLIKHWNAHLPSTTYLKSFALETVAGHLFGARQPNSLFDGLLLFFDFATYISGVMGPVARLHWSSNYNVSLGLPWPRAMDLSGLGINVLENLSTTRALRFAEKARVARDRLLRVEDQPTQANIARELGALLKLSFKI